MTRALILAAGQGTRMRPMTDQMPKSLVPLLGQPLLEHHARTLRSEGINQIAVASGYLGDQIANRGFEVYPNPNYANSNMVTSLFCAASFFRDTEDLIIAYGDIVYQRNNLRSMLKSDAEISLMVDTNWLDLWSTRFEDPLEDAETMTFAENHRITTLGKTPESYDQIQGQYTGLIKIRADVITPLMEFYDGLDRTASYDGQAFDQMYMTSFIQELIDGCHEVAAILVRSGWLEVDSCKDLNLYESLAKLGKLQRFWSPVA